ncbi:MAG TPA: hypothetical protein VN739_06700, partial [Nitrososphaerales archaeon]|nr:hypothetical protein [Nitrososphaerales archaeon]
LVLGPIGLYLMLRDRQNRAQVFLMMAMFLAIVIPYSMWQDVTAGVSFGPRFIIPAIPFLLLPVGKVIEEIKISRNIAHALYGVGSVINGSAALVSVIHPNFPTVPSWTTQILGFMIGSLKVGYIDVWWYAYAGADWWLFALAVLSVPIVIPILIDRRMITDQKRRRRLSGIEANEIVVEIDEGSD